MLHQGLTIVFVLLLHVVRLTHGRAWIIREVGNILCEVAAGLRPISVLLDILSVLGVLRRLRRVVLGGKGVRLLVDYGRVGHRVPV